MNDPTSDADSATRTHAPRLDQDSTLASSNPSEPANDNLHDVVSTSIPGYDILDELGRGGMGVVYRARQHGLNRLVALKMVIGAKDQRSLIRFLAESEAIAAVRHPHVVEVYQFGEYQGQPFLALEYCGGGSLDGQLQEGRIEPRKAAEWLAQIAEGVQAAHVLGIVHRDLKPQNVLLTESVELKVTDFGIAKRVTSEANLTSTHAVMGTPAYMSPEQAQGGTKFVGPEADVWSLGVMLYEMLAGKRPFEGEDSWAILGQVMKGQVPSLRKRVPTVPRDLVHIVNKCLQLEPKDRYASAGELASDLRNWLEGKPIQARSASVPERLVKWVRRNPTQSTAILGVVATVLLGGFGATLAVFWQRAETARQEAESARDKLARTEYGRTVQLAMQEWRDAEIERSQALLESCPRELRGWEWKYVSGVGKPYLQDLKVIGSHENPPVEAIACTKEGIRVMSDLKIREWGENGTFLRDWKPTPPSAGWEAMSPQGDLFLSASWADKGPCKLEVWDVTKASVVRQLNGPIGYVWCASFSANGRYLFTCHRDYNHTNKTFSTSLWDLQAGETLPLPDLLRQLMGDLSFAHCQFSPDSTRLLAIRSDGLVILMEVSTGKIIWNVRGPGFLGMSSVSGVAFRPDGKEIACATYDSSIHYVNSQNGNVAHVDPGTGDKINAIAFSPDGSRVLTGHENRKAVVRDRASGAIIRTFYGHLKPVKTVQFHPNGRWIVTGSEDGTTKIWDVGRNPEYREVEDRGMLGNAHSIATYMKEGIVYAIIADSSSTNGISTAHLWDVNQGKYLRTIAHHTGFITSAVVSADGTRLATSSDDGTAKIWDIASGRELLTLKGHEGKVKCVVWSADGSRVVTGGERDSTVRIWDATTGESLHVLHPVGQPGVDSWFEFSVVRFAPTGSRFITNGKDNSVMIWDAVTGQSVATFDNVQVGMRDAAFSPDGTRLLIAAWDGGKHTLTMWDATTGKKQLEMRGHSDYIRSARFDATGTRIVSTSQDQTIKVWDAIAGIELLSLKVGEKQGVAVFSADGRSILFGCSSMRIYDIPSDR